MFEKTHCVQDAGAEINPVRIIVTYIPSWPLRNLHCDVDASSRHRSRDLDNSNKFGQTK